MARHKVGQRIVIDCNFESKMTERELKSLVQQLGYSYSMNKRAKNPANLCIAGIGPVLKMLLARNNYERWRIDCSEKDYSELYRKEELVYLTADGDAVLETLDPSKVYIIGGIVDRNRHKLITYNKAKEQGIQTAKLPLDKYVDTKATKVLTVNHVFECLINFIDHQDWTKAFLETLPLRKHVIATPSNAQHNLST